ncbi:MAG: ATP-dependent DNA helicase RecQ [Pelotomaculum sp. PtaU1.Bin035]|nr:MAG: ATP-dependent DNA helicase RecQ [Pelotomaculum sp. PtaU1.Bin035]
MGTKQSLEEVLQRIFDFDCFRPGQKEVIEAALAGDDVLAVMPTGSGKSLCYQLPALLLPGLTLVVSPLVALMKDQVDNLEERNLFKATMLNSQLGMEDYRVRMHGIRNNSYKLIYVAPERLRNKYFAELFAELGIDLLVVDEAHCISQWGHDFRPDYLRVKEFYGQLPRRPCIIALTATATPEVKQDILNQLGIQDARMVLAGSDRPNLFISVKRIAREQEKRAALKDFLKERQGSGIIYAATRKESETVAVWIRDRLGIPTACYHAGLTPAERSRVQDAFVREEVRVVVATNAFGMGIDKANIRYVIHYNLPATLEAFYQEIGRAGRDGLPAQCLLLFSLKDKRLQEWIIDKDAVTSEDLASFWRACAKYSEGGQAAIPLAWLERSGLSEIKQRLVVSMLERLQAVKLIDRDGDFLYLEPGPQRPVPAAVRAALQEVEKRQVYRKDKLSAMMNWANTTGCRRNLLMEYFGEKPEGKTKPCCDSCLAIAAGRMEFSQEPLLALACIAELPRGVGRKKLACILRGVSSGNTSVIGYAHLNCYRSLAGRGEKNVLEMIDRLLADGYLALNGTEYPVVVLTKQGREALKKREPLPIGIKMSPNKEDNIIIESLEQDRG